MTDDESCEASGESFFGFNGEGLVNRRFDHHAILAAAALDDELGRESAVGGIDGRVVEHLDQASQPPHDDLRRDDLALRAVDQFAVLKQRSLVVLGSARLALQVFLVALLERRGGSLRSCLLALLAKRDLGY
jgi:hypothetical protein